MPSRMAPPAATDTPAAVACTAPQAPSARPMCSARSRLIAAHSVPTANSPLPKPIRATPARNIMGDSSGAEKITAAKAGSPSRAPTAATRKGSAPRPSMRADSAKAASAPPAISAVSALVAPTLRPRISPP